MKTELVVRPGIIAVNFDENTFHKGIIGFDAYWEYKHYNEDNS